MSGSAQEIIAELVAGNQRFLDGTSVKTSAGSLQRLKDFAVQGQAPKAIILCCSDSRAPVETIFDQDIGDLFVIRVAGNIIAPSLVGSIEFAASMFGTKLVMVMGHTRCGAVQATLEVLQTPTDHLSENVLDIVSRIKPHIHAVADMPGLSPDEKSNRAVAANALASVKQLRHASPLIEQWVQAGKIEIIGAVLDLTTGQVELL